MNERERILALVKQGIISTEEAIELLENSAKKQVKEEALKSEAQDFTVTHEKMEEAEPTAEETQKATDKKDRENFEKILESLASEISYFSSRVDEKTEALQILRRQISAKEERRQAIATQEELETMTPELSMEALRLDEELEALRSQERSLRQEKIKMEEQMRTLKKEQLETNVKSFGEKFGNKEEWKETASDLGSKLNKLGSQLGQFVTATVNSITDNLEWKEVDLNMNIPGLVTSKFKHEFNFENATATILDFQLANGNIQLKKWDKEDIHVAADVKIYAKYEEETPLAAFEARSNIEIDEDQLTFHVPNKRIRCDVVVSLPEREYDYLAIKLLNGNVSVDDFKGKDIYLKSTNGNMAFKNVEATMLELDGGNGHITIMDSRLVDVIAKLINGDITVKSHVSSSHLSIINGDIRITHTDLEVKRIEATSVNGTVKLSIPEDKSIELDAHSSLGSIKNRMENVEVINQRDEKTNKHLQFRRVVDNAPVMVELKTTNGSILLKDADAY
ncbi:daptomycin-sensing surface protein LiaX [Jeotgalibaca sp. A127]|uniref:daptomycin-sensing surface protein LiaX n=1 Tax=Jeotgalibaca sp. A127 TaxID=3457324 RepID=UPI003FCF91E6